MSKEEAKELEEKKEEEEKKENVVIVPRAVSITEMFNIIDDKLNLILEKLEKEE